MRILVVGGYGFIGSYVAERLYKEGHDVIILDNLSFGDKRNVTIKHRSYIFDAHERKAEEIFRYEKPDALIFLISPNQPLEEEYTSSAQGYLSGLINMLSLAVKYKLGKFIFLSSSAVYAAPEPGTSLTEDDACQPMTTIALNQWTGENYCLKWRELYNLDTLCLRVSDVYGYRKHTKGEGGVIDEWITRLEKDQTLIVKGRGEQAKDFIYVEDVADAIYRSMNTSYTGILNISSNKQTSLIQLLDCFQKFCADLNVQHYAAAPTDEANSCLNNTRAMKVLDWAPLYSIEEGLNKYHQQYLTSLKQGEKVPVRKKHWQIPTKVKDIFPYGENLLAFGLTLLFTLLPTDVGFYLLDYKILYILMMGLLYGSKQALIAVVFSWGLYIHNYLSIGMDMIGLFYDPENLARMVYYLFLGLIVGYTIDKKNSRLNIQAMDKKALEERYEFLQQIYRDTRTVKEELQNQLLNSEDSLGKIYDITKKLDSLEPEQIFVSAVQVLESVMKSRSISIYTISSNQLYIRLAARSRYSKEYLQSSLKISDLPLLQHVLQSRAVYVNKELDNGSPMLLAPVFDGNEPIAVVMIHQVEFEHFNLYYRNLLQVVVNLISASLSRALRYLNASKHERFVQGTSILKINYLDEVLRNKEENKRQHGTEYVVLEMVSLRSGLKDLEELSDLVASGLREQDCIGMSHTGTFFVVLSNTEEEGAEIVRKRLENKGIHTRIWRGDPLYV